MTAQSPLVTTDWLAKRLGQQDLVVVDATYHLPNLNRDARAEYTREHIAGAMFFDIDAIADHNTDLPHMLPPPGEFAAAMQALGIGDQTMVVAYDSYGLMSAARAWWSLRAFGHDRVAVLDGGLAKWKREGRPITNQPSSPRAPVAFTPRPRPAMIRSKAQVLANLASKAEQVLDARAAGRFQGATPEPRAGLRGGHIPGSRNLPFTRLVDPDEQTVVDADDIRARLHEAGIDPALPVVCSCGSGVTACVLALALELVGAKQVAVYDGSWSEWGQPGDTPVATG
jgi:thiosulfate/3-mercaptopyruvate sulfurtransferase